MGVTLTAVWRVWLWNLRGWMGVRLSWQAGRRFALLTSPRRALALGGWRDAPLAVMQNTPQHKWKDSWLWASSDDERASLPVSIVARVFVPYTLRRVRIEHLALVRLLARLLTAFNSQLLSRIINTGTCTCIPAAYVKRRTNTCVILAALAFYPCRLSLSKTRIKRL